MSKPYLIGICGGSGSGKTTFLKQLRRDFDLHELAIVSQDDYYKPREQQLSDAKGVKNFDLPKSIRKKAMRRDIQHLMKGNRLETEEYTFNNEEMVPTLKVIEPAPIIVVEGLFVFHYTKIAELFDLKIFIHAKDPHKIARRIIRDKSERNYPVDDVLYRYQAHVLPAYERYIAPYKDDADIVINNNAHFEQAFEVVKGFIKNRLQTVDG